MKKKKRITPAEAAKIMGVNPMFIRIGMRDERLRIGYAVKTSNRWTYYIDPILFAEQQHMTVEELGRIIKEIRSAAD